MKTHIITIVLLFLSCSTNKQTLQNNCDFNDTILESEKILDITPYVEDEGGWTLLSNDKVEIGVSPHSDGWKKYSIDKLSNIEKHIVYDKKHLKVINSFSFYNKGSFNIGNEYFYNEEGEIIKTINHNQYDKFPICYKEIIRATTKKAGKKFNFQGLERDSLDTNNEKIYFWKVYFQDSITIAPTLRHKFFKIDAKTNKTLEENTF